MNVSLTPELERLIQERVDSGMYHSASEVVREALRLLRDHDEIRQLRLEQLRRDIQVGLDQVEQGEYSVYTSNELPKLVDEIQAAGREKLSRRRRDIPG
jgi:antitoxin ParD1/3/4